MNVAILLSTYNGEKYLEEQLDSLLLQSYQDFVVYIRDDGSSDRTVNIINQYVMKDNRFINVGNSENLGCAASFINLLRNASADIYMFCDQDDYWLPNKLQRAVDYFSAIDPLQPTLYHCDLSVVDEKLNIIQNSFLQHQKMSAYDSMRKIIFSYKILLLVVHVLLMLHLRNLFFRELRAACKNDSYA